jgi:hypothetical protein
MVPERAGMGGDWRKLRNDELRDLYSSPGIIRVNKRRTMRWVGHVARMKGQRNTYRLLVGKPKRKIQLRRPRYKLEDNIKRDVKTQDDRAWNVRVDRHWDKGWVLVKGLMYLRGS